MTGIETNELLNRIERIEAAAFRLEYGAEKAANAAKQAQEAAERDITKSDILAALEDSSEEKIDDVDETEEIVKDEKTDAKGYW